MLRKGAEEARNELPNLLAAAEKGRPTIITRHGKPVARLVPAIGTAPRPEIAAVIEAMRTFQETEAPVLGDDLSIRDLINQGRRF